MPIPTPTSQAKRTRLDAPQVGEGLWTVFDAQTCCWFQLSTVQGDGDGLRVVTGIAPPTPPGAPGAVRLTVQGADPNINLVLAGLGTGYVVIDSPLEITGPVTLDSSLHVVGPVTLDSTLLVKGATTLQAALTQSAGTASFDSPTLVVDETAHKVGVGTIPIAGGAKLDVTGGYLRALNGPNIAPTAGTGVEVATFGNVGFITATDRTAAANVELNLTASPLKLNVLNAAAITLGGATTASSTLHVVGATALDAGLTVTGNVILSGVLAFNNVSSQIIPGTGALNITNNAQSHNNLSILDSGATTFWGPVTLGGGGGPGGLTLAAGDLTLFNAQLKRGSDTWLLPTGLGSDTLVTLTAPQTLTQKTLGSGTKILLGGDLTGDLYYNAGAGTLGRLAAGLTSTVLLGGGAGAAPAWGQVDRTRVLTTLPSGIMTLHDAQIKDAAQTFQAQLVAGPSGTGAHQFICASSAPTGATFSSSQIGVYGTTVTNIMLREMTDSVEAYWQASSIGVVFGALTGHDLQLVTANTSRIKVAAAGAVTQTGGNVTFGTNQLFIDETNNFVGINTAANPGSSCRLYLSGDIRWDNMTAPAPSGTSANLTSGNTGGPTGRAVTSWLKVLANGSVGFIPWFIA